MQVKWIEKYDYEVKLVFVDTSSAEFDVDLLLSADERENRRDEKEPEPTENRLSDS